MKCKKQIVISIVFILISIFWTSICMAKTAIVNTDTLKLRKEASTDSIVLELLNQNQKLEVLEESGDWVKVKVSGMTGFVHKDYIKMEEEKEEQNKVEEPQNTANENTTNENTTSVDTQNVVENNEIVQENNTTSEENNIVREEIAKKEVNIYILPLINSSKIGNLKKDTKVIVVDEVKGWVYIQTEQINGWIRKDALAQENNATNNNTSNVNNTNNITNNAGNATTISTTETQETPIEEKVMYVNYSSIYVRKGPSTSNEVLDSLVLNAQVIVIAEVGDWYKVKLNGETGYIAKRLLSSTKQEATSRGAEERNVEETQNTAQEQANASVQTTTTNSKGQEIVNYAKQYLGCKYVYGGSGPSTFDCSGFTMYVYKHFGISLSHSARAQSKNGTYVAKENLQPGDLVFFKDYETMDGIGHCGIYVGDGNFIHASSGTGYCVKISTLLSGSYNTRYETARRLI